MPYPGRREPRNKNKGGVHVAKTPKTKGKRFRGRGHKAQAALQPRNGTAPFASRSGSEPSHT